MGDAKYKRASRKRPCLIRDKPDYCSRAGDDSISFCARVIAGADHLSRRERCFFYHNRTLHDNSFQPKNEPPRFHKKQTEEIALAPLEIRDFVYASLIRLSPASNCLTTGQKGLQTRGLENFEDYGSLPCSSFARKNLAARLRRLLNQNFPAFVRENPHGIRHVPGFWIDGEGEANLCQERDYAQPLLLIPNRNSVGKIQACQIRLTGEIKAKQKRYRWLSLPALNSAGSGTPLHYPGWRNFGQGDAAEKPILVTEGALKANGVAALCPEYFPIANGGLSCLQELIVNFSRGKPLYLAFDGDFSEKAVVARQPSKLLKLRLDDNRNNQSAAATKIFVWARGAKGIDDALLQGERINEIAFLDWFSALDEHCSNEVEQSLGRVI